MGKIFDTLKYGTCHTEKLFCFQFATLRDGKMILLKTWGENEIKGILHL